MAISPLAASAILGAVPAAYQLGTGISQDIKARRLGKKKRPEYVIPGEITNNVGLAKGAYNAASAYGLPGQGRIENNLMRSQAQAQEGILQSQQNPSASLLGLTAVNQNTNNAVADLGVNAAQFRQGNMDNTRQGLMSANQVLAQYRDMEFEKNRMEPFRNAMQAAAALRAGSISNIHGSLGSLANTAGQFINKSPSGGSTPPSTATPPIASGQIGQQTAMGQSSSTAIFDALKNSPQFAGMTDEEIAQQIQSLLQK